MPDITMSPVYMASPVSLLTTSTRGWLTPTDCMADPFVFSDILQLPNRRRGELPRCVKHGLDDLHVSGASAEVALDGRLDLRNVRFGILAKEVPDRHDHAAGAESALDRKS